MSQPQAVDQNSIRIKTEVKRDAGQVSFTRDQVVEITNKKPFEQNLPYAQTEQDLSSKAPVEFLKDAPIREGGGVDSARYKPGMYKPKQSIISQNPFESR